MRTGDGAAAPETPARGTLVLRYSQMIQLIRLRAARACGIEPIGRESSVCFRALAPFRSEVRNPQQGLSLTKNGHAQIYARDKHIS
jgi:hypothetical protein